MADFIDEYFVKPMQFPLDYAPYNLYNTAVYAIVALLAAYLIYKWIRAKKIKITPSFYNAVVPFIFLGGILRVIQDAQILPRSIDLFGIAIYPFISPGIYVMVFAILAVVYYVSALSAKHDQLLLLSKIRDSGIGLSAVLFAILALWAFSKIKFDAVALFFAILILAALCLVAFELIKGKIFRQGGVPEIKNLERTTVFSQSLDGAATFIGVSFGGYSEQHVVANSIFSAFGSPFAFFLIKLIFALAIVFILRKEAESRDEHIYILALVTIFGLAPGIRDALRLLFAV
ncbi:MAG: DUF63 family protein [Candidatus Micrarchaeota archaeon]